MIRLIKKKATGAMADIIAKRNPHHLELTRKRLLVSCNIADLMESKGWTPAQFAEKFSKSEDEILDWLGGQTDFDIDTLTKISLVLDVDVQALFAPIKSQKSDKKKMEAQEELEFA